MTLLRVMLRNTIRRPVRLALTIGGLAMVVLAFGLLRLTLDEWHSGVKAAANNRLITVHAMSDSLQLPLAYKERMAVIPGVQLVHYGNVFGVEYRDAKESFGAFAEEMKTFFETYPEVILNDSDRLAFLQDRGVPHRLEARCPVRLEGRGCDPAQGNHPCRELGAGRPRHLPQQQSRHHG